jgi:hypothetical protein
MTWGELRWDETSKSNNQKNQLPWKQEAIKDADEVKWLRKGWWLCKVRCVFL